MQCFFFSSLPSSCSISSHSASPARSPKVAIDGEFTPSQYLTASPLLERPGQNIRTHLLSPAGAYSRNVHLPEPDLLILRRIPEANEHDFALQSPWAHCASREDLRFISSGYRPKAQVTRGIHIVLQRKMDKIHDSVVEEHKMERDGSSRINEDNVWEGGEDFLDVLLGLEQSKEVGFHPTADDIKRFATLPAVTLLSLLPTASRSRAAIQLNLDVLTNAVFANQPVHCPPVFGGVFRFINLSMVAAPISVFSSRA
ncbi:uncharacterized protein J3R85_015087 [Psidium guajava]|nr:uncharacterized protein J3R85_015087 [Psidium guajava]